MAESIEELNSSPEGRSVVERFFLNHDMLEKPLVKLISELPEGQQVSVSAYISESARLSEIYTGFEESTARYISSMLIEGTGNLKELESLFESSFNWVRELGYETLASIYEEKFNEDISSLYPAIQDAPYSHTELEKLSLDTAARQKLESLEPGIVDYLKENRGIKYFGRYPIDLLLEQKKD
ncbi:MAG TPA: hypothetical protein VG621_01635 [Candidatus Paceibacterota bacterium]|nr:hypothetical protein [Candidatus Paceibacterota bacterium]